MEVNMKLHNTLTKQVDDFIPIDQEVVKMYSCGPTVYDQVHIGNLSSFIYVDILRRNLTVNGQKVMHVMNFTDVDDKTISRSLEEFGHQGPMDALLKLTRKYSDVFLQDMEAVGNDVDAVTFVRATDCIDEMQTIIKDLLKKKFAYIADDGIYFSIESYKKSGKIYGQLSEVSSGSTSEARIQNDEYDKASVHDFALWKIQKPGEPAWDFEIKGKHLNGRPGWHIECSAMSRKFLNQPFDIHTGGVDLIFPHHENEIAQSTAGQDNPVMAQVFVHNEHILIDERKMSKSLGNFYTLADLKSKGYKPLDLRVLVLQSHYRSHAHFSWENLTAGQNRLRDLYALAALRWQTLSSLSNESEFSFSNVALEISQHLANDIDTPQVMAVLSQISATLQNRLIKTDELSQFDTMIKTIDSFTGLNLSTVRDISESQKKIIKDREAARSKQKWSQSDDLRVQLEQHGVGLRDTADGTIWFPM